jgi:hypothetical protein
MTFPLAILEYKMGVLKTILWTNVGGLAGILVFSFLSDQLIYLWRKYIILFIRKRLLPKKPSAPPRKIVTKRNRRIVRIKNRYGLPGIALATPVLLSIPVGAFLMERYFEKKRLRLAYLAGANLIWSFLYAFFYAFCYEFYLQWITK